MILQALNNYYERLLADPEVDVSEFGFGRQGVHFALALDRNGNLAGRPLDLRDEKGRPKRIEVPGPVVRTVGVAANFAWDNTGYVLGADDKDRPARTAETHAAFKKLAVEVLDGVEDAGAKVLLAFLDGWDPARAPELPGWEQMVGLNVVFMLDGEPGFLHDRPAFREAWLRHLESSGDAKKGMCLVTGEIAPIPLTHAKIKGVIGAQTSGASLVSFNFDAAKSFGKEQNANAPVSERAAFAYTTALNHLLAPESKRKLRVGETTVLFWTDAPGEAEPLFNYAMGGKPPEAEDDGLARRLEGYLSAVAQGKYPEELGDAQARFYVLGLSPNAARLSVRFWHVGTVGDMAANLGRHYRALALQRRFDNEPEHPSPWQLLRELAPQRDTGNLSPLLYGQFVRAVVEGLDYPRTLLAAAVGRIRADQEINYLRTAVIKASLVRNLHEEIDMALNKENKKTGYLLGRLFATLERTQNTALGNVNASVRDRYFASAAATPGLVFPILIRNAQNWLSKIAKDKEKGGLARFYDGLVAEIIGGLDGVRGYPRTLPLEDQGLFTIGYYQQMQDFYTKKEKKTED